VRISKASSLLLVFAALLLCGAPLEAADPPVATEAEQEDEIPPSMPGSVTATALSSTSIRVDWTAATDNPGGGVTGYNINRCQGASCVGVYTAFATERSFTNNGLSSGTTYTYEVNAFDGAGNQGAPRSATATTPDVVPPTVPGGLSATATSGTQINLSWSASTDGGGVSGYQIEKCSGAGCANFTPLASSASTSYSATGLTSATSYSFRVRAYDAVPNYSGYSSIASAITIDTVAPSGPATITASAAASGTQIDLSWPAATDNVAVSGYLVERCTGAGCGSFTQIASTAATSYSATGLTSGTSYSFRVRAYDAVPNYGAYSAVKSAVTADVTPPSAPASLSATAASTTQINLTWPACSDNVGVSGYQIEKCPGAECGNFALVATTASTSYSVTGLVSGHAYSFRVRAHDAVPSYGGYSPWASATTQGAPTPPNETITYEYDALGRLVKVTRAGTVNNGEDASYTYDAAGNRTNVTVNGNY
jgi:YD repeat-containing protein